MAVVRLSVAARPAGVGACELCLDGSVELSDAVLIRHVDGSSVTFAACEQCARAVRRVAAAVGQDTDGILVDDAELPFRAEPTGGGAQVVRAAPELIHEYADELADADGTRYVIQAFAQPQRGGTWVGWLKFNAVGAATVLHTDVETTQPDRAAVVYWAGGLEPTYLEGAFERARRRASRRPQAR